MACGWKRAAAIAALTVGLALPAAAASNATGATLQPAERGPDIDERMREVHKSFQGGEPVKGIRLLLPIVAGPDRGIRNEKEIADLVKRYPDAGVAFVREAQMLAQTFRGKDQALRAARLADWVFRIGLIDMIQHRNLQAAIAADAKAQNRDGTAAWLVDESYGEVPGLNDPEEQRIIFERSLAQAMKVRSDGLVVRLLQHADAAADPAEAARIKEVWKKLKMSEATRSRLERSAPGFRDPAQLPPAPPPPLAVPPPRLPPSPPADDLSDELDRLNSSILRLQEQMERDREAAEDRRRRHETERYWHEKKERKQAEDRAREADRLRAMEHAREIQARNERTVREMEEQRRHIERLRQEEHRRLTERARQQNDAHREQDRRQLEESRRIEEERRRNIERSTAEEARRREQWLREDAGRKAEEQRRREESARRAEEERRRAHDQQRRVEEDRRRAEDAARRAEEDRRRAQDQQRKAEEERKRMEEMARRSQENFKRWSK